MRHSSTSDESSVALSFFRLSSSLFFIQTILFSLPMLRFLQPTISYSSGEPVIDVALGVTSFWGLYIVTEAITALNQKNDNAWDFRTKILSTMSKIPSVPLCGENSCLGIE